MPVSFLADASGLVAGLDLAIGLEEVDDRQVGRGLAVRDRAALEQEPAVRAVGVDELPESRDLPTPGSPMTATTWP